MNRGMPLFCMVLTLGAASMMLAHPHDDGEKVKIISAQKIQEKLDGKAAKFTAVEVTIEPGESGLPHRHPGPGFACVVEGEYALGINDQPTKRFKAGDVFYEATGVLHRVSKNPAAKGRTRLIAFVLHPRETDEIAVPEQAKGPTTEGNREPQE